MGLKQMVYMKVEDAFSDLLAKYLIDNSLTLKKFCEINDLPLYMTHKVFSKDIKMGIAPSFLKKVAKIIKVPRGTLLGQEQACKVGGDFSKREVVRA